MDERTVYVVYHSDYDEYHEVARYFDEEKANYVAMVLGLSVDAVELEFEHFNQELFNYIVDTGLRCYRADTRFYEGEDPKLEISLDPITYLDRGIYNIVTSDCFESDGETLRSVYGTVWATSENEARSYVVRVADENKCEFTHIEDIYYLEDKDAPE